MAFGFWTAAKFKGGNPNALDRWGSSPAFPALATSGTGQPGSNNGIECGGANATSTPSGAVNGNGSPFNPAPTTPNGIVYAGNPGNPTAPGGVGNPAHAVSQYDVACFQATQMP
jgi:hypothetical protein